MNFLTVFIPGILSWIDIVLFYPFIQIQQGVLKHILTPEKSYYPEDNVLLMSVELGMANQFIRDLSKNVKRGLKTKAEQGWLPGIAPIGYLNEKYGDKGYKKVIKDPERFPLLRKMWDLMLTGTHSVREILNLANNAWGFRTRMIKNEAGKPLSMSGLYRVFTNPFYYGWFEFQGKWHKGAHEAMITRDEFDHVQHLLGRPDNPRPQKHQFAFTGIIRCGECGAMIIAEEKWKKQKNGNAHHYVYYHCTKRRDPDSCSQKSIEEEELEADVDALLTRVQISERFKDWAIKYLNGINDREIEDRTAIYKNLQGTHNKVQTEIDELTRMRYRGSINDEEFIREKDRLRVKLDPIKEKLNDTECRAGNWVEASEQTFELAYQARVWFAHGDIQFKKTILQIVGSNLLLKDKKLFIEANNPIVIIGNTPFKARSEIELKTQALEPLNNSLNKRQTTDFVDGFPIGLRLVEDARTWWVINLHFQEGIVLEAQLKHLFELVGSKEKLAA